MADEMDEDNTQSGARPTDDTAPVSIPRQPDRRPAAGQPHQERPSAVPPYAPPPQYALPPEYPPPPPYGEEPQFQQMRRTNPLAVSSFVLAFFAVLVSIVLGHIALSQIKKTGERGKGLAVAGLCISYASVVALVAVLGTWWMVGVNARNAATSTFPDAAGGVGTYSQQSSTTPQPYYSAPTADQVPGYGAPSYGSEPAFSLPASSSAPTDGPAGVPLPASSVPVSSADKAYCQDRGVLLWLAKSATYRGALCSIDGSLTMVSMASDVGGNVTLPARADSGSFSATGKDGTVYSYAQGEVTIATPSKMFTEVTILWESGASPSLAAPGDLGLSQPISYPSCDGSVIVVYGAAWNDTTNASQVQKLLNAHPGSSYMRTDLSCRDFLGPSKANSGGAYVYAVYSLASSESAACQQTNGTPYYPRVLSNDRDPGDNQLKCR